jgi:hypothetical protein
MLTHLLSTPRDLTFRRVRTRKLLQQSESQLLAQPPITRRRRAFRRAVGTEQGACQLLAQSLSTRRNPGVPLLDPELLNRLTAPDCEFKSVAQGGSKKTDLQFHALQH